MAHALLSPSSASRWLECPPSARLEEQMEDTAGRAAFEGTIAHAIVEILLLLELGRISKKEYKARLDLLKKEKFSITIYKPDGTTEVVQDEEPAFNEEMMDHAHDYVTIVMQQYQEALQKVPSSRIYPEQKFDISVYVPDSFGTCDTPIVSEPVLYIFDLKYGKGVPVSSENNRQMMLYALGAYLEFSRYYEIEEVHMTIVQPRIDNTSTAVISVEDLLRWAEKVLRPTAQLAFEGKGEFNPGKHCQFCRVRPTCRANHDYQMRIIELEKTPVQLTDAEIVQVLNQMRLVEGWLTSVKEYALNEAITKNRQWPGMKLVEGTSRRKYSDSEAVIQLLQDKGYKLTEISTQKPIGLGEMTKLIGKVNFAEWLNPLIIKPPGKLTLVPTEDDRVPYDSAEAAEAAFKD